MAFVVFHGFVGLLFCCFVCALCYRYDVIIISALSLCLMIELSALNLESVNARISIIYQHRNEFNWSNPTIISYYETIFMIYLNNDFTQHIIRLNLKQNTFKTVRN